MRKDYLISQEEFPQIIRKLYDSPTKQHVWRMADPRHKGLDPTVRTARRETARAIALSTVTQHAVAERDANLQWLRIHVQHQVREFNFVAQLDSCGWLSDFARAAAQPLPHHSECTGGLCPMLGENPVHPLHALIALGIVENLVQCKGRKPPNYVIEAEFPTTIEETIDERHDSVSYGQWLMRVLGFQVHVLLIGVSRVPRC